MRRALLLLVLATLAVSPVAARQRIFGWCQKGAQVVKTHGSNSSNVFQQTFPACVATVYVSGTLTLATLFADDIGTSKPNPFTSDSTGQWYFYAANGRYDVALTGGGITGTLTFPDILANDTGGGVPGLGTVTNTIGALGVGLPVIGNGGADVTVGTKTGTTTNFATFTGATHIGGCAQWDASGNLTALVSGCGSGGGGMSGPGVTVIGNVPQWSNTGGTTVSNGLGVVTAVGSPGLDINIATEKAIRTAITAATSGVTGPGTTTIGFLPTWGNALGTSLATGLAVSATPAATTVVESDGTGKIASTWLPSSISSSTSGNAATATAPASVPTLCSAGSYARGVDTAFNAAGCTVDGGGVGGITSLNSLTPASQTFATGTTGTDFGIVSSGSTHTFNLPSASAANRGLLTSADWSTFNGKQAAVSVSAPITLAANVIGITLPITVARGGTGQTNATGGFNALSPMTTVGDDIGYNGTNNVRVPVGTDGFCKIADSTQAVGWRWSACGAASNIWSAIGDPTGTLALSMGAFLTAFTYGNATGSTALMTWTDTPTNNGIGPLARFTTTSGSTAIPWQADANGTGWRVSASTGALSSIGATVSGKWCPAGITSGVACLTVADAAGTPADIKLPTATGAALSVLQTDGATPQQTSWKAAAMVVATATATAQGASITTTNLLASASAGLYRISAYLATSTNGTGNVVTTLGWTDTVGAKTLASPATLTLTTGAFVQSTVFAQVAAASNITYATAWTTSGAYNLYLTLERLQ